MSSPDLTHRASTEQNAGQQVAELTHQLRLKDELVVQLTERLEQTVEQLDRLHRSGADRGTGRPGGDASQFSSKLEEALENWGQANEQYDAIIERLDGLFDLLEKGGGASHGGHTPSSRPAPAPARSAPVASASASTPATGSFWEKMKAGMMDGGPASAASAAPVTPAYQPAATPAADAFSPTVAPSGDTLPPLVINDLPPPAVVDIETADLEQLRAAVTERDKYIVALIAQFRTIESLPPLPADLEKAGLVPEELVLCVRELETRLKAKIQREEMDLSIERAKMARERAKLDAIKGQLEAQIRRLAAPPEQPVELPKVDGHGKNMGWLNRLRGTTKDKDKE